MKRSDRKLPSEAHLQWSLSLSAVFMFENHVTELDREYLKRKRRYWH